MFQETEKGELVSVLIAIQVLPPARRRSKRTDSRPEPESVAAAETATLPDRTAPSAGAVKEAVGAVLSTRRFATVAEFVWFPATSVARTRRS